MTDHSNNSKSLNLGLIFQDENARGLTHPFFAPLINAFKNEAEMRGYDITFLNHNIGMENMSYLEHSRFRHVDGVCLICSRFVTDEVLELVHSEIPCVTVDHLFKHVPAVLSDNENGVNMLVNYAVALGHRRIAFIHGHNNSIVTKTRIYQFQTAMNYHKLEIPEHYLQSGLYADIELTRELVLKLLNLPDRPTCILLPDDYCYLGAQDAAKEAGLRIPEDISFAGYDGISLTQTLRPSLTTIHQDRDALGKESARKLIDRIEHPQTASDHAIILPVRLIEGETMAKV